ncbi:MAG: AMP-binding protein [Spirochaetes bacterium]|nr:AMP-binding protein [Spirochaetota bacterium]
MFLKDHQKTALIYQSRKISYRDVLNQVALYADQFPISKQGRVAIISEARPEWIYAFYSTWVNQGVAVPFDYLASSDEMSYMIDDCTPAMVFCSAESKEKVLIALESTSHQPNIISFDGLSLPEETTIPHINTIEVIDQDETAVMIYTSGTTGNPKGVMLSYGNLLSNINCIAHENNQPSNYYLKEDTCISILPLHHILPLQGNILMPLNVGATTCFIDQITSEEIFKTLNNYGVSIIIGVPRLFEMIHKGLMDKINSNKVAKILFKISRAINNYQLSCKIFKKVRAAFGGKIKFCSVGGAKMPPSISRDLHAVGLKILEGYGLTETSPMVCFNRIDDYSFGPVGRPIAGVEVKISNEELLVKGPNVMKGYYKKPEETAKVLKDGWFHTGDKAAIDEKGKITITGRIKDIIVLTNGKNIDPVEIEQKLMNGYSLIKEVGVIEHKGVLFAVIFPDLHQVKDNNIVNIKETLKWEVLDRYNQKVSQYKKILNFEVITEELPKTRIGKLKRFELHDILEAKNIKSSDIIEPDIEEYQILKEFIKEIANKNILPTDHIEFDLGLDSLDKLELLEKIEHTFGVMVKEEIFSKYPKINELAQHLNKIKHQIVNETINWKEILKKKMEFKLPKFHFLTNFSMNMVRPISKVYFRLKARGVENIPQNKPVIFAPNHQSALDGVLLTSILKKKVRKNTYFFAKDRNFKSKIKRKIAANSNVILMNINKNLKDNIQKLALLLEKGKNVVIFPEGARSRDGQIHDFKKTFAILSKELNIPVIPVAIDGTYRSLSIGKMIPKPSKVNIEFLKPVLPENCNYQQIINQTKEKILKALGKKSFESNKL